MSQTFRTLPPAHYISPTAEEMRAVAEKIGLSKYSPDLVADIANLCAGGKIIPPSAYKEQVKKNVEEKLPAPDKEGKWSTNHGSTTNKSVKIGEEVEKAMKKNQDICDYLQTLDFSKLPGVSPLEKAINSFKLVSEKDEKEMGEKVAKKINKVLDQVEKLTQDEKDLLFVEQGASGPGGAGKGLELDPSQTLKLAEDMLRGKDVMLEISRTLDQLTKMQVRKQKKQEVDPAGEEVRNRPIRHLGELNKISKSYLGIRQQSKSYFDYLAVTGGIPVRERVTTIEKKQLLYIIIDCSGSMGDGKRIFKAGGILMNRLKAVIAGEAEVYVRLFDTSLKTEYHASTTAEAKELIKHFTEKNYSGGSTDISGCARLAQARIQEIIAEGATYKPELVIVTDGTDTIDLKPAKDFPCTKMHAFVVDTANVALCEVAKATGGVGINL